MPEGVSRNQLVGWAVAVLVIGVLGARYLARDAPGQPPQGGSAAPAARLEQAPGSGGRIVVHVAGAVRRPGVYRMRSGSRIDDAVRRAGGATHRGDLSAVNLAAKVEDGRQVLVPLRAAPAATGVATGDGAAAGAAVAGGVAAPGPPLNLNTATAEQLDTLDGVGPATVQKILQYRQEKGGFARVEELAQVPGIGPKRLAALRDRVTT